MAQEKDGISPKVRSGEGLKEFISCKGFGSLNDELKEKAIIEFSNTSIKNNESSNGWIGKILGVRTENIGLYIAFIISAALIIVGVIYIFLNDDSGIEFWKLILPVITAALGYIFGKSTDS